MTFQKIETLSLKNVTLYKADEFIACFTSLRVLELASSDLLINYNQPSISLSHEARENLTCLAVSQCMQNSQKFTIQNILKLISNNQLP
jgi:hypothetical protein